MDEQSLLRPWTGFFEGLYSMSNSKQCSTSWMPTSSGPFIILFFKKSANFKRRMHCTTAHSSCASLLSVFLLKKKKLHTRLCRLFIYITNKYFYVLLMGLKMCGSDVRTTESSVHFKSIIVSWQLTWLRDFFLFFCFLNHKIVYFVFTWYTKIKHDNNT